MPFWSTSFCTTVISAKFLPIHYEKDYSLNIIVAYCKFRTENEKIYFYDKRIPWPSFPNFNLLILAVTNQLNQLWNQLKVGQRWGSLLPQPFAVFSILPVSEWRRANRLYPPRSQFERENVEQTSLSSRSYCGAPLMKTNSVVGFTGEMTKLSYTAHVFSKFFVWNIVKKSSRYQMLKTCTVSPEIFPSPKGYFFQELLQCVLHIAECSAKLSRNIFVALIVLFQLKFYYFTYFHINFFSLRFFKMEFNFSFLSI